MCAERASAFHRIKMCSRETRSIDRVTLIRAGRENARAAIIFGVIPVAVYISSAYVAKNGTWFTIMFLSTHTHTHFLFCIHLVTNISIITFIIT